jgi:acyl carrier protein
VSSTSPEEIRTFVIESLGEPLADAGIPVADVGDDFDLVASGLVDSFGLLEILTAVEGRFGVEVDFEALDPEKLARVGPLCRFIAAQS